MTRTTGRYSVTPAILAACAHPRSYGELAAITGSEPESLHVLCKRLRDSGELEAIDGGTRHVRHVITGSAK